MKNTGENRTGFVDDTPENAVEIDSIALRFRTFSDYYFHFFFRPSLQNVQSVYNTRNSALIQRRGFYFPKKL